jgi:hypothetical protein
MMAETSFLYEGLENRGFLRGRKPVYEAVARASRNSILEAAEEAAQVTHLSELPQEHSVFAPSTTIGLGGGRALCINIRCRMRKLGELSRFAALYADRVYIQNFFADHHPDSHASRVDSDDDARIAFYEDLLLIGAIRPLVERNNRTGH